MKSKLTKYLVSWDNGKTGDYNLHGGGEYLEFEPAFRRSLELVAAGYWVSLDFLEKGQTMSIPIREWPKGTA